MADRILVFYGSYRVDRMGIRLADFIVGGLRDRGADVELIDAKAVGLPMLDRMYKEHAPGSAPPAMEALAGKIRAADAFVFVTGEYNWRSEEHTSELPSLMRISYAVSSLSNKTKQKKLPDTH